jgi:hypothetical protein
MGWCCDPVGGRNNDVVAYKVQVCSGNFVGVNCARINAGFFVARDFPGLRNHHLR